MYSDSQNLDLSLDHSLSYFFKTMSSKNLCSDRCQIVVCAICGIVICPTHEAHRPHPVFGIGLLCSIDYRYMLKLQFVEDKQKLKQNTVDLKNTSIPRDLKIRSNPRKLSPEEMATEPPNPRCPPLDKKKEEKYASYTGIGSVNDWVQNK